MKKNNKNKYENDDDQNVLRSANSMENLKIKEKTDLIKFLNDQLQTPVVFYSSYYRKHGNNILQRNYNKKGLKDRKKNEDEDSIDGMDEKNINKSSETIASNSGKGTNANNNSNNPINNNKEKSVRKITYSKLCDEETCYFDLKKKAHAFPMKWFEAQTTHNEYQQIPRTRKETDMSENDRNNNFTIFNRQTLNKSKWEKMDRNMQAKYYIYENPLPDIQDFVVNARKRNIQYERNIKEQIQKICGPELTTAKLNELLEKKRQESQEATQKASQRLKKHFLWQLDTRNNDLQYLLEGQHTALDAIRLKEYLLLKPLPMRTNLNITNKDKRRLGSLLSNR